MAQPPTIYKPGKLNYVWNYLSSTLDNFKAKLLGYRTYKAMLTQTGTDAPVAVVLENTLKLTVTYQYDSAGIYYALVNTPLFDSPTETIDGRKVEVVMTPQSVLNPSTIVNTISAYPVFIYVIGIATWDNDLANFVDDVLGNYCSTILEIKIYNK
jgi:hypothetical protein